MPYRLTLFHIAFICVCEMVVFIVTYYNIVLNFKCRLAQICFILQRVVIFVTIMREWKKYISEYCK